MEIFDDRFLATMEQVVTIHHTIYPQIDPRDIFFESLALRALHLAGAAGANMDQTTANMAGPDLIVGEQRLSIKTETGKGTKPGLITITKLCTTEREPWDAETLLERAGAHLLRYERMLMLRAIWHEEQIHYQLLEIPLELLRLLGFVQLEAVGRRSGIGSLAGDVSVGGERVFRVHFDASDRKCSVRGLLVNRCNMLREWDQRL